MSRAAQTLQSEEKPVLARSAIIALMRAADGARREMTRSLQAFDLTLPQFNVLTILRRHDQLPTFDVAARMVEATPGITRLMTTLAAKGYIRRSRSTEDRRQHLCSLTAAGRRIVDEAEVPFAAAQHRLIGALSRSETLHLTALLRHVPPDATDAAASTAGDTRRQRGR
jgi:MarR family transcriptional regulator, 2-MHQ and catechol-resistance regulon repressor